MVDRRESIRTVVRLVRWRQRGSGTFDATEGLPDWGRGKPGLLVLGRKAEGRLGVVRAVREVLVADGGKMGVGRGSERRSLRIHGRRWEGGGREKEKAMKRQPTTSKQRDNDNGERQ